MMEGTTSDGPRAAHLDASKPYADATSTDAPSYQTDRFRHSKIMSLRHVRYTTRIKPLVLSQRRVSTRRQFTVTLRSSFSSLTRPCAKPRALGFLTASCGQELQRRGAKRKSSLNLDDVPQGVIESDALPPQDDVEPEYPPLLQQVRNNMLKFDHCVLVTRVGGFYEVCAGFQNTGVD
jgi:hypothetical protein